MPALDLQTSCLCSPVGKGSMQLPRGCPLAPAWAATKPTLSISMSQRNRCQLPAVLMRLFCEACPHHSDFQSKR